MKWAAAQVLLILDNPTTRVSVPYSLRILNSFRKIYLLHFFGLCLVSFQQISLMIL